jgi:hypothetical protein
MTEYKRYYPNSPLQGDLVIKFYRSGDQIRGFVRKVAERGTADAIFPGEEMQPAAAFTLAESHREGRSVWVELTEDVVWDDKWGTLTF